MNMPFFQHTQANDPVRPLIDATVAGGIQSISATSPRIVDLFHHYFELVPAATDALKLEVYKLRYQVYCLETGFEAAEDCQSMLDAAGRSIYYEEDEFDHRSVHYLIRHKASQTYVATTRLILPNSQDIDAPFPIEIHCELQEKISGDARRRLGETSRYAVSREARRRLGAVPAKCVLGSSAPSGRDLERMTQRHLSMGLIACLVQASRQNGIRHWYAVMEPALLRMMRHNGIHFSPIGPTTDYHGPRVPCMLDVDDMIASVQTTHNAIWELLTNDGEFA